MKLQGPQRQGSYAIGVCRARSTFAGRSVKPDPPKADDDVAPDQDVEADKGKHAGHIPQGAARLAQEGSPVTA